MNIYPILIPNIYENPAVQSIRFECSEISLDQGLYPMMRIIEIKDLKCSLPFPRENSNANQSSFCDAIEKTENYRF